MNGRIVGIIACQILLIVSSYLILVFYEDQSAFLGNTINLSGKNRFLGEFLYQKTIVYVLSNNSVSPLDTIHSIDSNIKILSKGGTIYAQSLNGLENNTTIMAVPSKFSDDLEELSTNWNLYEAGVMSEIYPTKDKNILNDQDLDGQRSQFIASADKITADLSNYSKQEVSNMETLQITLLGINVAVHLFLLRMILKLVRDDQSKKILLQQLSNDKKKLELESKFALLQKDISQSFIVDIEDKLHELNEQINLIREHKDYTINNRVIRETFQYLFSIIQKLSQSKIQLEYQKSYYDQLVKKLGENISAISGGNKKLASTKPEDLVSMIRSYIDIVNLMVYEQSIPPKLGKNLTDTLYDIVDHLTLKSGKL